MSEVSHKLSIGLLGFGIMGRGIAQVFAMTGYDVVVKPSSSASYERNFKSLEKNIKRALRHTDDPEQTLEVVSSRITEILEYEGFKDCDIVIEAVTEDFELKQQLLEILSKHLKPSAILASNTSSISITKLSQCTNRPERFIGIHFMNPAPLMPLVEVISGLSTDKSVMQTTLDILDGLGKTSVIASDFPGFILNRVLIPMINEAVFTLYEGAGDVVAIDSALKLGANHPMGPLELADFIGLDTCLSIMRVMREGFSDTKYRPCPLLVRLVEAGWLGRKTKKGF